MSESSSECPRCYDVKGAFPMILAITPALFCASCVLVHVLLFWRERQLSKLRAKRRKLRQEREKEAGETAGASCATESESETNIFCPSFIYFLLYAVGFSLLVVAAWQHQNQDGGAEVVFIASGFVCVTLALLMCGWSSYKDFQDHNALFSKDEETDEESDEECMDVEKGVSKEPVSTPPTPKVNLRTTKADSLREEEVENVSQSTLTLPEVERPADEDDATSLTEKVETVLILCQD